MKKTIMIGMLFLSLIIVKDASSQIRVNVNINTQPAWGPVGYDYVEYYYLPDIEAYYYVPRHQFVYLSGGRWIFSTNLPPRYRSYDLDRGYKVVVNEPRAYRNFHADRVRFAGYRNNHSQVIIRNSNDRRYEVRRDYRENHGRKYNRH
jgi:hypothetical protein